MLVILKRVFETLGADGTASADREPSSRTSTRRRVEQFERFASARTLTDPQTRRRRRRRQVIHESAGYILCASLAETSPNDDYALAL